MALDREMASVIAFMLKATGNLQPYYEKMPQDFIVPSVYFPPPEVDSQGFTMSTYALNFVWFVKFFHSKSSLAFDLGFTAQNALKSVRNAVPVVDNEGNPTKRIIRLRDPLLRPMDNAAQITLMWDSPRPYRRVESQAIAAINATIELKSAYDSALAIINQEEE